MERLLLLFPTKLVPGFMSKHRRQFVSRCFVMTKNIIDISATPLPDGIEFSVLTDDEIDRIAAHDEALRRIDYRDRQKNGDICYGLKAAGNIVSYNWIRFNECCVFCSFPWEIKFLPLNEKQAFTYDFYTYKQYRKKGYGTLLKRRLLQELRANGIEEIFSIVYRHNYKSLKIHLRLNYDAGYLFNGYQLLDWTHFLLIEKSELPEMSRWIDQFSLDNAAQDK